MIPELATDRLVLRAPQAEDFEGVAGMLCSGRAQYVDGPHDRDSAWNSFCVDLAGWVIHGFGHWSMIERQTGAWAGWIGYGHPAWFPETEIGWLIAAPFEGRGLAREAGAAALDWGRGQRHIRSLVSYIDPPNARSIRLAAALGATHDSDAAAPSPGDRVYRHWGQP